MLTPPLLERVDDAARWICLAIICAFLAGMQATLLCVCLIALPVTQDYLWFGATLPVNIVILAWLLVRARFTITRPHDAA